jgi:alpha(1,3/1,4) fucosyltransferase
MRSSQPVKIWFVDFWHPETVEAIRANPLFELVNEHFDVVLSESPEVVFYSVFGSRHLQYVCKRIQFVGENQPPNLLAADYTFSFVDVETDRSFRLPLYRLYRDYQAVRLGPRVVPDNWHSRRFCSFVVSNPSDASGRVTFFRSLSARRPVASGGGYLNNLGYRVQDKNAFLREYRFSIAFENSFAVGYTTEKLLQVLVAGAIPIYWGNPKAADELNRDAFINCHEFARQADVVEYVLELDQDPVAMSKMLTAPIFAQDQFPRACLGAEIARKLGLALFGRCHVTRGTKRMQYLYGEAQRVAHLVRKAARRMKGR